MSEVRSGMIPWAKPKSDQYEDETVRAVGSSLFLRPQGWIRRAEVERPDQQ